jgi:hypothetical protein
MRVSTAVWLAFGFALAAPAVIHATTVGTQVADNAKVEPVTYTSSHGRSSLTAIIAPSPVIDTSASYFVGTGDGSQGSWVRP